MDFEHLFSSEKSKLGYTKTLKKTKKPP